MSQTSKREYIAVTRLRYARASKKAKGQILDEFCATLVYHRKTAIRILAGPAPRQSRRRRSARTYGDRALGVLKAIWEAAGSPWSVRLKALLPWAKQRWAIPPEVEQQPIAISPRTIDRRLQPHKQQLRRRQYGGPNPGRSSSTHPDPRRNILDGATIPPSVTTINGLTGRLQGGSLEGYEASTRRKRRLR